MFFVASSMLWLNSTRLWGIWIWNYLSFNKFVMHFYDDMKIPCWAWAHPSMPRKWFSLLNSLLQILGAIFFNFPLQPIYYLSYDNIANGNYWCSDSLWSRVSEIMYDLFDFIYSPCWALPWWTIQIPSSEVISIIKCLF